jgi:hypothetical protein
MNAIEMIEEAGFDAVEASNADETIAILEARSGIGVLQLPCFRATRSARDRSPSSRTTSRTSFLLWPVSRTICVVTLLPDGAVKDVEGCEQRGGAITFVVVRHRPDTALASSANPAGCGRAPDLALLVNRENDRMGMRIDVEADDVFEFLGELRVVRQLERADAVRRELVASRIRCTERRLTAVASIRPVQWVASPGGGPSARSNHSLHGASRQRLLAGLRVLWRVSPSTPSAMNSACHLHTTGFDLPERRMISAVPQPSAVAKIRPHLPAG